MKVSVLVVAAAGLLAAGSGYAQSGADVAKAKGCLNCHAESTKKVGPAMKDIAAKYKDNQSADTDLVAKLKSGKGHPKIAASDAEVKSAVDYFLSHK